MEEQPTVITKKIQAFLNELERDTKQESPKVFIMFVMYIYALINNGMYFEFNEVLKRFDSNRYPPKFVYALALIVVRNKDFVMNIEAFKRKITPYLQKMLIYKGVKEVIEKL